MAHMHAILRQRDILFWIAGARLLFAKETFPFKDRTCRLNVSCERMPGLPAGFGGHFPNKHPKLLPNRVFIGIFGWHSLAGLFELLQKPVKMFNELSHSHG